MSPPPRADQQRSLAQLGRGLLCTYRVAWAVLVTASLVVLGLSLIESSAHSLIVAVRLLKGAIAVAIAVILLRRRPRDPVAALLCLALLIWTITSSFDFTSVPQLALFLDRFRFLLFALALLLFPDCTWRPAWTRKVAAATILVFVLGVAETLGLLPTRLFLPLAIACVVGAVSSLVARFRMADTIMLRQQLRWVALGLVSGISLILLARLGHELSSALPRARELALLWEAMFQLGIVAVALGFLVSLLRYRLFDAEAAISRSAGYAVLTVALVATFAGTEALIERLGQAYLGMEVGDISAAMAAALAAVLLNPLHSRISEWAEEWFQRDLVQLKRDLPALVSDLAISASTRDLGAAILPLVNRALHATRSALLLDDRVVAASGIGEDQARQWWEDRRRHEAFPDSRRIDDALFPVRVAPRDCVHRGTAWLALGPRPDSTLIGSDEMEVLSSVLPAVRHALALTVTRDSQKAQLMRALRDTRRRIDEIQDRVKSLELGHNAVEPVPFARRSDQQRQQRKAG